MEDGHSFNAQDTQRRGMSTRALLLWVLGAFLIGSAATYIFASEDNLGMGDLFRLRSGQDAVAEPVEDTEEAEPATVATEPDKVVAQDAREAVERVEQVEEQTGGIDQRVAAMEQRLTRLDLQSQAAAGNAARAEGMLIAFAARRAVERGQPLGFLQDQLSLRFGDARPNAVQTLIDASENPVTLEQLLVRLDGLSPNLTDIPEEAGILTRIGHELSQLFAVRTDDTPSPFAERRLERARSSLETGRIENAISEVRALPNAEAAGDWLADAERYGAAQRALEVLETAAVLEPRELRDSSGDRVEQPSPAS